MNKLVDLFSIDFRSNIQQDFYQYNFDTNDLQDEIMMLKLITILLVILTQPLFAFHSCSMIIKTMLEPNESNDHSKTGQCTILQVFFVLYHPCTRFSYIAICIPKLFLVILCLSQTILYQKSLTPTTHQFI